MTKGPEGIRQALLGVIEEFEESLRDDDLREKILKLVPANLLLRQLGVSLDELCDASSAQDRILSYMRKYVGEVIHGNELMVVSGISEYARRIRQLRVENGWSIVSGMTLRHLRNDAERGDPSELDMLPQMRPDEYMLLSDVQDRDAAHRWRAANEIRKQRASVQSKLLSYLKANVGRPVTGEELRYIANKTEWARRTRELRTEQGWSISTRSNGRPDLPVGVYVLETERQLPAHDRRIPDSERRTALMRDGYKCQKCGWNRDLWVADDPRHLEAHHVVHHADGGSNSADNLVTYCNICHDVVHRSEP